MFELSDIVVRFPYPGLFCLLILGSIGFPFPEDAILLLCGFLIAQQIVLPLPAFLVVYAGIIIGDFIIYSLGKKYGRAVITHRRFKKLLPAEKLVSLENGYRRFGVLFIVLGRQIIGLRAQIILAAGILGMSSRRFLVTDAFASLMTIMIMLSLGYAGTHSLIKNHPAGIHGEYLLILFFPLAVSFCVIKWHRSKRRARTIAVDNAAIEEIGI
jgi:membrane protein DedA with SNARE-associated domain